MNLVNVLLKRKLRKNTILFPCHVMVNRDIFKKLLQLNSGLFRYSLEVGELSEPVFTDSGIHIILRTAQMQTFYNDSGNILAMIFFIYL